MLVGAHGKFKQRGTTTFRQTLEVCESSSFGDKLALHVIPREQEDERCDPFN
jgi:hypothetical protein